MPIIDGVSFMGFFSDLFSSNETNNKNKKDFDKNGDYEPWNFEEEELEEDDYYYEDDE